MASVGAMRAADRAEAAGREKDIEQMVCMSRGEEFEEKQSTSGSPRAAQARVHCQVVSSDWAAFLLNG